MLPLSDGIRSREFPIVNVALIATNVLVWVLYQLPNLDRSVTELAFHPCEVDRSCSVVGQDWPITVLTSMFMHGSWDHLLGNMLFLAVFGKNVEDAFGHFRYLVFYLAGGVAAAALQTVMTLQFSSDADARIPMLGASGAIAAVMGAYFVLYPNARIKTLLGIFIVQIPAWVYLGGWFLYQLHEANYSLLEPTEGGSGVAFFAHVGGFAFGFLVARVLRDSGRLDTQDAWRQRLQPL
jgi:hypothetical protein